MNHKLTNNLILEHLRYFGYQLEARILEKEFKVKDPKYTNDRSKLMDFLQKGIDKSPDSQGYSSIKDDGISQLSGGADQSTRSFKIKNRTFNKKTGTTSFLHKPSDRVYQHIIKRAPMKREFSSEADHVIEPESIGRVTQDRLNDSYVVDYHPNYFSHDEANNNYYDKHPLPHQEELSQYDTPERTEYNAKPPVVRNPFPRPSKAVDLPRHLYAPKRPFNSNLPNISNKSTRYTTGKIPPRPALKKNTTRSMNNSFVTPSNLRHEQSFAMNPTESRTYVNIEARHSSVPRERPIADEPRSSSGYMKSDKAFLGNNGSFKQHYNAFWSNPQPVPMVTGLKNRSNNSSHVSLVHNFLVNEKKEAILNEGGIIKPKRFVAGNNEESDNKLLRYNDRLDGGNIGRLGPVPTKVDFTAPDSSQFGRNGEPINQRGGNGQAEGGYVPVVQRTNARMDPQTFEFLLTSTLWSEDEIKRYFEVYQSMVYSPTQPMTVKKFKDFVRQARNINGENFVDCLFYFGPQLNLLASNQGLINFQEAIVILDRLNQDNPFSLMHFIFRLTVGEDSKRANLQLVETILKEIRPANSKGRVAMLLDSLEFVCGHEGVERGGSLSFEEYLEIMRRFEPLRKFW